MSEFLKIGFNQSECFESFKVSKTLNHSEKVQIIGYINTDNLEI